MNREFRLAALFCVFAASCSLPGERSDTSPRSEDVQREEKEKTDDVTALDFLALDGGTTPESQCYKERNLSLPVGDIVVVDGNNSDWANIAPVIEDAGGDRAWDVANLYFATQGRDLVGAITGDFSPETANIFLQFGVFSETGDSLQQMQLRQLKITQNQIYLKTGPEWKVLDGDMATVRSNQGFIELRLSSLLIGEVLAHDVWWMKPIFQDPAGEDLDTVGIQYFLSPFHTSQRFSLRQCILAKGSPYVLTHIVESGLNPGAVGSVVNIFRKSASLMLKGFRESSSDLHQASLLLTKKPVLHPPLDYGSLSVYDRDTAANVSEGDMQNLNQGGYAERAIFSRLIDLQASLFIMANGFRHDPVFADALAVVLTRKIVEQQLGINFFLTKMHSASQDFLAIADPAGNDVGPEKSAAFGYMMSFTFPHTDIFNAWSESRGFSAQSFRAALEQVVPDPAVVDRLWRGWVEAGPYDQEFRPEVFQDTDHDGLPLLVERKVGTKANDVDSNFDGWSDLTEVVYSEYHLQPITKPRFISIDGIINEWLDLIPNRISKDEDPTGTQCGAEGDIESFAGLSKAEKLAIGARTKKNKSDFLGWRVAIDFRKEKRSYLLLTDPDGQGYSIQYNGKTISRTRTPWKYSHGAGEFLVTPEQLTKVPHDLTDPENVTFKLETFILDKGKAKFCDDTIWFKPVITI
ncbi:MAG: hypothetical protein AB7T49_02315 [Oligoflexales bacterium]